MTGISNLSIYNEYDPDLISCQNLAYSNHEYMCFSELKKIMENNNDKLMVATPSLKRHRQVPLPPPSRPPPPPPTSQPPAIPPKLYQNLPILSEPILVVNSNRLTYSTTSPVLNNTNNSTCGSSIILTQSTGNTTNSSSATMIINDDELISTQAAKSRLSNHLLSPIMTSSRADLQKHTISEALNDSMLFDNIENKCTTRLTHSLPINRTLNQKYRRLSFNETLESSDDLQQTVQINQANSNNTLIQKSFSNINYDLFTQNQNQQVSFTTSSSSLSASSSLSSLVLQPPSPFKSSSSDPIQTPSKSNFKSANLQNKQIKKVSFMLQDDILLNTSDYDESDNLALRNETCTSSISSNSSNSSSSSLDYHSQYGKMIFANHDYFLNLHAQHIEPSSSSSSSTCSSTSSGYKSINMSNKSSPTDLNVFIRHNQDRLERLRQKRAELVLAKNTNKLSEILDYTEANQIDNCLNLKSISTKFFNTLQHNTRSPLVNSLPRKVVRYQ